MEQWIQIEGSVLLWIQENLRCGALNGAMRLFSHLGDGGAFWIVLTLILLAFRQTRRVGVCCALSMLMTLLVVNLTIKPLIARTRPYEVVNGLKILVDAEKSFSFPSGHSANSFACAWAIFRTAPRSCGVPALIFAGLIAFSRLYVGVHYPTDVLAGVAIGLLMSEIAVRLLRLARQRWAKRGQRGI